MSMYHNYKRPYYHIKGVDFKEGNIDFFDLAIGQEKEDGELVTRYETNIEIPCQTVGEFQLQAINVRWDMYDATGKKHDSCDALVRFLIGSWQPFELPLWWFRGAPYYFTGSASPIIIQEQQNFVVTVKPSVLARGLHGTIGIILDGLYKTPVA